jgi:AsmA protein
MNVIRHVAFALGVVAALLVGGVAVLVATFDADRLKTEIVRIVQERKGRVLSIQGGLGLALWPRLEIDLGRTTLSERGGEKPFAAIDRLSASLALFPLLSRRVVVDEVSVDGVQVNLVRGKDGRFNFDDLLVWDEAGSDPVRFDVARLRIRSGQIRYADDGKGWSVDLGGVSLVTGRIGNTADGRADLAVERVSDLPGFPLKAKARLSTDYRFDLDRHLFGLSGLDLKANAEMVGARAVDVFLTVAEVDVTGNPGAVDAKKLRMGVTGTAGIDTFELEVDAPRLSVSSVQVRANAIAIAATVAGSQPALKAKLKLSDLEATSSELKIAAATLGVNVMQGKTSVTGQLSSSISADVLARTCDLPQLSGEIALAHPALARKIVRVPIAGSIHADLVGASAAGSLSSRFDDTRLDAKWAIHEFSPLAVRIDADIDRIDLDRYLSPGAKSAGSSAQVASGRAFDLSAPWGWKLDGTLRVGSIHAHDLEARNLRVDVRTGKGTVDANAMATDVYRNNTGNGAQINAEGGAVQ